MGFGLAEPELFLRRERNARESAAAGGGGYVGLPHNFRSQAKLLAVMNGIFERVMTVEVAGVEYGEGHAVGGGGFETRNVKCETQSGGAVGGGVVLDGGPVEVHVVVMDREEEEEGWGSGEDVGTEDEIGEESLSAVEEEARVVAGRIVELMEERRGVR